MKREEFRWRNWADYGHTTITSQWGSRGTTCGSDALAMLTPDKSPAQLEKLYLPKNMKHFGVRTMLRALKAEGYETKHFKNPEAVVNQTHHKDDWAFDYVRQAHCFLAVCHSTKTGASWFVIQDGRVWHNGLLFTTSPVFCLTNPVIECILVRKKQQ